MELFAWGTRCFAGSKLGFGGDFVVNYFSFGEVVVRALVGGASTPVLDTRIWGAGCIRHVGHLRWVFGEDVKFELK